MTTAIFVVGLIVGWFLRGWIQEKLGLFKPKNDKSDSDGPTDGLPVRGVKWAGKKAAELIFGKPGKKKGDNDER